VFYQFDKPFYCIETNDSEVSCIDFLFWGHHLFLTIALNEAKQTDFLALHALILNEFRTRDVL